MAAAVHTRFGLNHSRPPDVSTPGSKASGGLGVCWSVCGGEPSVSTDPSPSSPPRGAASTQVVETIDAELRLLAAVRQSIREHNGVPRREIDRLLDARAASTLDASPPLEI